MHIYMYALWTHRNTNHKSRKMQLKKNGYLDWPPPRSPLPKMSLLQDISWKVASTKLHARLYFPPFIFLFILFSSKIVTWSLSKRKIRKKWMTRQEMMKVTIIEATGWGLGPWSKPFLNHRSRNSENVKTIDGNLDGRKLIKGNWWKWNYLNWMKLDHVKLVKSENYEIFCVSDGWFSVCSNNLIEE